jgi:hypothetical protein
MSTTARSSGSSQDSISGSVQVQRLRAAATLTPEQLGTVKEGKPATMDHGQYDYLRGLMRAQDGMSATEINHSLDKYAELRGALGDAYRIMGNPNIGPRPAITVVSPTSPGTFRPC